MSFTAPFVCESHRLRFNRKTPQKAVLFHFLAAFHAVVLLYYELISALWDDGTHLRFLLHIIAPLRLSHNTHPSAHARTHVCAPLLRLPLSVWPHSRLTWLMGFHPLQRSVRSLLISCVSRLGSLPRACHGRVTLLDDRTAHFQAVVSQTQWLVSKKHIKIELSYFTDGFYFCGNAFLWIHSTNNSFPGC